MIWVGCERSWRLKNRYPDWMWYALGQSNVNIAFRKKGIFFFQQAYLASVAIASPTRELQKMKWVKTPRLVQHPNAANAWCHESIRIRDNWNQKCFCTNIRYRLDRNNLREATTNRKVLPPSPVTGPYVGFFSNQRLSKITKSACITPGSQHKRVRIKFKVQRSVQFSPS